MQRIDLVAIGTPVIDYYAYLDKSIEKILRKYKIQKKCTNYLNLNRLKNLLKSLRIISKNAGDNAKNVAVAFKKSGGEKVAYFGIVGIDEDGQFFKDRLKKYKIIDKTIKKNGITGKIICLIEKNGERTFVANLGVGTKYKIKIENIKPKILFCTNITLIHPRVGKSVFKIIKKLSKSGTKIAISLESKNLIKKNILKTIKICKLADYLFLNEEELEALGNKKREVLKLPLTVFLKRGSKGSVAIENGKIIAKQKALKIKVKDLTGAGDFFAGGALAAIIKNKSIKKVLKQATKSAAKIIKKVGVEP